MLLSDSTVSATLEEKLRWAFKIYDKDMSGGYHIVKAPSSP
jgi:Ca2+-binding EF-hand superfamily protein